MFLYIRGKKRIDELLDYIKFANQDDLSLIWLDFSLKMLETKAFLEYGIPDENQPAILNNRRELIKFTMHASIIVDKYLREELKESKLIKKNLDSAGIKLEYFENYDMQNIFKKHILDFPIETQYLVINRITLLISGLFWQCHLHKSLKRKFNILIDELNKNKNTEKFSYIFHVLSPKEVNYYLVELSDDHIKKLYEYEINYLVIPE